MRDDDDDDVDEFTFTRSLLLSYEHDGGDGMRCEEGKKFYESLGGVAGMRVFCLCTTELLQRLLMVPVTTRRRRKRYKMRGLCSQDSVVRCVWGERVLWAQRRRHLSVFWSVRGDEWWGGFTRLGCGEFAHTHLHTLTRCVLCLTHWSLAQRINPRDVDGIDVVAGCRWRSLATFVSVLCVLHARTHSQSILHFTISRVRCCDGSSQKIQRRRRGETM